jgi:hypothetical protein
LRVGQGAGNVAAVGAEVKDMWKLSIDVEQAIREPVCYLVSEVVDFTTFLNIRSRSLFLQELDLLVEDLQGWGSGSLDGIFSRQERWSPPPEG